MSFDLAWAAGLFDGEGNVTSRPRVGAGWSSFGLTLQLAQSGEECPEVLRRFQRAVHGLGRIRGPYLKKNPKHKPVWVFQASDLQTVTAIGELLGPWLGDIKRQQFETALQNRAGSRSRGPYRRGVAA